MNKIFVFLRCMCFAFFLLFFFFGPVPAFRAGPVREPMSWMPSTFFIHTENADWWSQLIHFFLFISLLLCCLYLCLLKLCSHWGMRISMRLQQQSWIVIIWETGTGQCLRMTVWEMIPLFSFVNTGLIAVCLSSLLESAFLSLAVSLCLSLCFLFLASLFFRKSVSVWTTSPVESVLFSSFFIPPFHLLCTQRVEQLSRLSSCF